jgi:hypothetical protein
MRLFRRKPKNPEVDLFNIRRPHAESVESIMHSVGEGTYSGFPRDGKYLLLRVDIYPDNYEDLLWRREATHREAKQALNEFKKYCGMNPQRTSTVHHDDVHGVWWGQPRNKPAAGLIIMHPKQFGATALGRDLRSAMGLDDESDLD